MMKRILRSKKSTATWMTLMVGAVAMLQSCLDPQSPGVEYMPDMYRSPALEPYAEYKGASWATDSVEAKLPVEGTIPRGFLPYSLPDDTAGYRMSADIKNPLPNSEEIVEQGKVLYTKFCIHCHGETGQADGKVVTVGGHPPPSPYNGRALKDKKEGTIYHVITYGKNAMGSHASQIDPEDRWKIVRYVQTLQQQ